MSEQFYDRHGEGFTSGPHTDELTHTVALADGRSLAGCVSAWLDVSAEHGLEMTGAKSKYRPAEAERLAREVHALLSRQTDISIGVIAFYARQREEILAALEGMQITERDGTGSYRVRSQWRHLDSGEERLRVGTVDAFQGKEFDVVFLSITRCNHHEVRDEATRRRRYGFLLVENRMCVAMSRQRRLLIAVDDLAMTQTADATESVPALVAFRQLCEGPHGTIISG